MNKYLNRYGKKRRRFALFVVLFVATITAVVFMYFGWTSCKENVAMLSEQLSLFKKEVYVASKKLPRGTVLTEEILDKQIRYSDYASEAFITKEDMGKELSLDIDEGTCIMDFMVSGSESNTREFFLGCADIPEHIKEGDRVDIRIRYGNAEEYVVLSDKIILNSLIENGMVLHLAEEELLMISSAITDTEIFSKTMLYIVAYPEYANAEKSKVTYIANKDVLLLLGREKSEGESRTALERRLLQNRQ